MFKGKTVLITGGTGSLGYALTKKLLEKNVEQIRIFSRNEFKQISMESSIPDERLRFLIGDIRDQKRLIRATEDVDIVFHAAALKHVPSNEFNPNEAIKTNISGTNNVINACRINNIKKLILLSTDKAVYPINTMGMTKAIAEKLILNNYKNTKTSISIVRYGNVLNSRGSVVETFIKQLLDKKCKFLTVTDEKMTRFLLPLNDAVNLVETAEKSKSYGEVYIKNSPAAKIIDLAKACMEILKIKKKIDFIGIRAGEKLHETLISYEESFYTKKYKNHFVIKFNKNLQDSDFYMHGYKKGRMFKFSSNNQKLIKINDIKKILSKDNYIKKLLKKLNK